MRQVFLLCQLTQAVIRQVSAFTCQRAFFKQRKYVATNFLKDLCRFASVATICSSMSILSSSTSKSTFPLNHADHARLVTFDARREILVFLACTSPLRAGKKCTNAPQRIRRRH